MLQLEEFLDENSHRSYPFKYPNTVPTELILDIHILISGVTSTIDYKDRVGISRVVVSKTGMSITFVIVDGGSATDIGTIHVPTTDPQKTHTFSLYKNGILVDGSITTGYFSNDFIGTYNISPDDEFTDNRILFEGCVIPVTNWCTGMVINDKLYTGLVTINAGEGIVIEDTATADGWDLNFKLKEYNTISNDTIITEIENQFEEIVDTQGFIKTINGVEPDAEGNINITVGEPVDAEPPSYVEGATIIHDNGFINTIAVDAGLNSSIVIRDVITPFCYDEASFTIDDAVLETLKSNATELAERVQTIENHLTALENNLNTVNMQLVKMG
jgi:hypothetical protein